MQQQNGWSWLDGSAEVSIPTWSKFEVSILCPFVFWSVRCCFVVYKKLENKDLTLKEFKICIALKLITSFINQKLSCPNHCQSKCTKVQRPSTIPPSHLPIFLETRRRWTVCSQAGKEKRAFVTCSLCDVACCLQKERNYYLQYHS